MQMERFVIGHNADPSNWRRRLDRLKPQCLEIFVPPKYAEGDGLIALRKEFEQMASHPVAQKLQFASCHFPWGETVGTYSRYNVIDHQYFYPLTEIARGFCGFCDAIGLPSKRTVLNFHNLYEFPLTVLNELKDNGRLSDIREIFLEHARRQTIAAKGILDIFGLPIILTNENNPPIGDGHRHSVVDVFAEDSEERSAHVDMRACMDLSHFFMTRFYYDLPSNDRPSFPYLEHESDNDHACKCELNIDGYLSRLRPIYFHVSDTTRPGIYPECEGLPVGEGETPWDVFLPAAARFAARTKDKLYMIIEIKGGHTEEGTERCAASEEYLRRRIEDCFASGFIDAITEESPQS